MKRWYGDPTNSLGVFFNSLCCGAYLLALTPVCTAALTYGSSITLSEAPVAFIGEQRGDLVGTVASIGDVNGDGFDDFLISNYRVRTEPLQKFYLFLGKSSDFLPQASISSADTVFIGDSEVISESISGLGDVNGDGLEDFLLGGVFLFFGKSVAWEQQASVLTADVTFQLNSRRPGISSGARVGDVNRDGYDDILIATTEHLNINPGTVDGRAFLVFGKPSGWAAQVELESSSASFTDNHDYSLVVAGAGDVNGDGLSDFLISSPFRQGGIVYLFFGNPFGWKGEIPLSSADASFIGGLSPRDADEAGRSMSTAGDVNGDGFSDILIGAPKNGANGRRSGQTYLILGKASGWIKNASLAFVSASYIGEASYDSSGGAVATIGDVNRDGYDDFIIGAPGHLPVGGCGKAYLILGRSSGWAMRTSLSQASVLLLGENSGDYAGSHVAGGGDVNGDGCDDFWVGAQLNNDGGGSAGKVYLFFGTSQLTLLRPTQLWILNTLGQVHLLPSSEHEP